MGTLSDTRRLGSCQLSQNTLTRLPCPRSPSSTDGSPSGKAPSLPHLHPDTEEPLAILATVCHHLSSDVPLREAEREMSSGGFSLLRGDRHGVGRQPGPQAVSGTVDWAGHLYG